MAVNPNATINSVINTGLPEGVPESFTEPQAQSLYRLIVSTVNNLLTQIELYCGLTQKPMTQWSLLRPTDTIRRQNLGRLYALCGELVTFGALINLYNDAGVLKFRNANSSTGRPAQGYCNVNNTSQSGAAVGQYAEIILAQGILAVAGVVPGDKLYLSSVNGTMQNTPDVTAGHIEQFIGIGIATNLVYIDISLGTYIQH